MAAPCPICGAQARDFVLAKLDFQYVRCRTCRSVFLDPIPAPDALAASYQDSTYFTGSETMGYRNYAEMHKALAPHFRRRLQTLSGALPAHGHLLDFGCADGYFLELARAAGWRVAGVEISQPMAEMTRQRLGVEVAHVLDALSARDFDAVTLWEVIEHLAQPVAELVSLREHLRPGGALMLSTPNAGHWQALREPDGWIGYRPPAHVVLLTAESLARALAAVGFERVTVQRTAPLPVLPPWLRRASAPLERGLADGSARPWLLARTAWRIIRAVGQKLARRPDDIYMTLEALAFRPI